MLVCVKVDVPVRWMVTRGCWYWELDLCNLPKIVCNQEKNNKQSLFYICHVGAKAHFYCKKQFPILHVFYSLIYKIAQLNMGSALFALTVLLGFYHIFLHRTKRACQQVYYNDFFYLLFIVGTGHVVCVLGTWLCCSRYQL